ncbi:MAG: cysteine desulfurase family protein [Clostridia bacterium]|nr:cysteine desulfurase family protein [Clostridia bacterium]
MIYFDNSATTVVDIDVEKVMHKYHCEAYYNASSLHKFSLDVKKDIQQARQVMANAIGCYASEIYFTGSGTEADNMAISGSIRRKGNIVTSYAEHSAVLNTVMQFRSKGYEIRLCNLMSDGRIDIQHLASLVDNDTVVVTAMYVNNETGAVNDIERIVRLVKGINAQTLVMCDGVQALGKIPVDVKKLGIDFFTFSGHKIHASKGIGGLYIKNGVHINPIIHGGGQESNLRSGTEYVAGIMGMACATTKAIATMQSNSIKYAEYKSIICNRLQEIGHYVLLCPDNSVPSILAIGLEDIRSNTLLNLLEQQDVIIGLGSACNSKKGISKGIQATGLDAKYLNGIVRISFSRYNTVQDVDQLANCLVDSIKQLRRMLGLT